MNEEVLLCDFLLTPRMQRPFGPEKKRVFHIWQRTLTGSREMKNIVLGDDSPMTLSEMP